ncbi:NACHT domain-containing protein [Streptomyces microflavus]|uniref:NACHT domain-containing protein n=1 Tax=Streptomyces microflavus TaxID=1919 RepID=UPI0029A28E53|nr:NACHT domain-containing protein [Streptomyces microflavus]MDX2402371.1 NACHT domain-containing protein [Streptomyces microflavus]
MVEIVTSALGLLGKAAATPIKDAALRRPGVVNLLMKLRLDPQQPPKDFYSLYAYTLVESLYGQPDSLIRLFKDEHVQQSFYRSFSDDNWARLERELTEAAERNQESNEFGHLPYNIEDETKGFIEKFQELVSRSRMAYEMRFENKLDNVSEMLEQVLKTRHQEEEHRQSEDPTRATSSPAERLSDDVQVWFKAVGYRVQEQWHVSNSSVALLVEVPQRRGKFDTVIVLCVDGELAPYHLEILWDLVERKEAAEGWGVAQLRVSQAARRQAGESNATLYCYSFDELIDLEADFEPYIEWLEQEVRTRHIDTRFVALSCRKEEIDPRTEKAFETSSYDWRSGGLDNYVDTWLADPAKKHLSLLGEFGMGKSWFALHLAGRMAAGWKDAKERGVARPRIPLVIPLRDYAKQTSVSALLSEFFFHKHQIEIRNYEVFNVLNRMGRFLLIFDGFDEMASRTDRNTMVANFWELAKIVEPRAKVLLSSRTEYFPEAKEARDLFNARVSAAATVAETDGPIFEIVELVPFDDEQIRMMLAHLLTPEKLQVVMEHEGVRDLMRRPVMSELVIDALPEIERGATINLARIYLYAIKRKMDRDVSSERTFTSRADKLFFLCEVAWEMIRTNELSLNYKDFPEKLRACFGPVVENSQDLDYWEQDMRNQSMLVRNSRGDYGPSHKSLLEFLIAFRFAAELGLLEEDFLRLIPGVERQNANQYSWSRYFTMRGEDGKFPAFSGFQAEDFDKLSENFGSSEYNPVVFEFLAAIIKESPTYQEVLLNHIQNTSQSSNPGNLGGNCAHLLVLAGGSLANADLRETKLHGLGLMGDMQLDVSLEGADLSDADLTSTRLAYFEKQGANFKGARLRGSEILVSSVTPRHVMINGDGAVTILRSDHQNIRSWGGGDSTVLHWPSGDFCTEPEVFPLERPRDQSWSSGIFAWGNEGWGYSDAHGSKVRSSVTGKVIKSIPETALASVMWDGQHAFVTMDRENNDFHWNVVDPDSGKVIATCDESITHQEGVSMWRTGAFSKGVGIWASSKDQTRIYQMTAHTTGFEEVYRVPIGTGNLEGNFPSLGFRVNEDSVYFLDHDLKPLIFTKQQISEAFDEVSDADYTIFSPDLFRAVSISNKILSVWDIQSETWSKAWSRPIAAGASTAPVISADGSTMLIGLRSGEFSSWSVCTGDRLKSISLNPHLQGASFSAGDLEEWERDSILLAGGSIGVE